MSPIPCTSLVQGGSTAAAIEGEARARPKKAAVRKRIGPIVPRRGGAARYHRAVPRPLPLALAGVVAIAVLTVAGSAASEEPAPPPLPARHRLVYENLFALRYNPLGIEDQVLVGYRGRLWDDPSPV